MIKTLKIFGIVFVLLLAALAAFVLTFDANAYKKDIVTQVEKHTGRKFSIDGDIQLTLYPWIGLKVEDVTLGNAKRFSKRPLSKISQLEVKVELLPLLKKQLRIDKVRLHGLVASLETNAAGNNNWSNLVKSSGASTRSKSEVSTSSSGVSLAGLAVNGIELIGAVINWSDAQTGTKAKIVDLTLNTGTIEFNELIAVKLSAGVVSSKPDIKAKIALQGGVKFNQALNVFDVEDFKLSVITHLESLTPKPIVLKLTTSTHLDLKQGTAHGNAKISSVGAAIGSTFNVTNINTQPVVNGTLSSNSMNGRILAEKLQIKLPPMASPKSLTKISINSSIQATPSSVRLDNLKLMLDGSLLSGSIYIEDIMRPKINYSLNLKPIVLDSYLPPPPPPPTNTEIVNAQILGTKKVDTKIPLPLDLLRKIHLDGVLNIEKLTLKNVSASEVKLPVKMANGVLIMHPVTMKLLNGAVRAKFGLDVRSLPAYIADIKASNLRAGTIVDPMLARMMGNNKVTLQSAAKFDVKVKASGNSVLALKKSASGKIQVDAKKTSLNGVDIKYFSHQKVADYIDKKNIPFMEGYRSEYSPVNKTAFNLFHASFKASQGKLINEDLILDSSSIKVTGKGFVDIVNESIDYRALLDYKVDKYVRKVDKLKDIPMEFRIYGPFSKLIYDFNEKKYFNSAGNILKKEARAKLNKEVDKRKKEAEKKVKEKLKQKSKDLLKGLFK